MEITFSPEVTKYVNEIKKKNPQLLKKISKQLGLFKENPEHPSLRTHKLQGNLSNSWSISIERNVRMIYCVSNNKIVFFQMGTHDEVYKK